MRFPEWVKEDPCLRKIVFTEAACEGLSKCVGEEARKSKSKFYGDTESFKAAVSEVVKRRIGVLIAATIGATIGNAGQEGLWKREGQRRRNDAQTNDRGERRTPSDTFPRSGCESTIFL